LSESKVIKAIQCIILAGMAFASCAAIVLADQPLTEAEQSRRQLERIKQDPEHYARLQRELEVFIQQSPDEQARLRQLDRDLHALNSGAYARLHRVMDRYASWLENLSEADRQQVFSASDASERLRRIKAIRREQWLSRLPKAYRDQLADASPDQRTALIEKFRLEEKKRTSQWQFAFQHWDDLLRGQLKKRLADFDAPVQKYVTAHLVPRLSKDELTRLQSAEGNWPDYPRTLAELSDKHALPLPGPAQGPKEFKDLPSDVQAVLTKNLKPWQRLRLLGHEGKWPEYALAVTKMAETNKISLPRPLGPTHSWDFEPAIQQFIDKDLAGLLDANEKVHLEKTEGQWPEYPRQVRQLALKHRRMVPGTGLPGPRDYWDRFRSHAQAAATGPANPEVPDQVLREFARKELTAKERQEYRADSFDSSSRERLKEEYFKRHPGKLKELSQSDRKKEP
jgi:hypothetical protein